MSRFGNNDITATLPIALFGSVDYYAAMGAFSHVVIDDTMRYDKRRKSTHRFTVVDTHGIKNLTVPVSKPEDIAGPLYWSDIMLSRHGAWWHVVEETLASAYGRTPFFEFYIDRLRRFFAPTTVNEYRDVATLCRESDRAVRAILNLDNDVTYASTLSADANYTPQNLIPPTHSVEYYQVRANKFGFTPGLSILDLIFNMGPESPLILSEMALKRP